MRALILFMALFVSQMKTLQDEPVVHLHQNQNHIPAEFGGSVVELIDPPPVIQLPKLPPRPNAQGNLWFVDVRNQGSVAVAIMGNAQFSVRVGAGRQVRIKSTGAGYKVER